MAQKFPVYDAAGNLVGNYAWREIIRLFAGRWRLEGGAFYLDADKPSESAALSSGTASSDSAAHASTSVMRGQDGNDVNRYEDANGRLLGYFRDDDVDPAVAAHVRGAGADNRVVERLGLMAKSRMALLRESLGKTYLTATQRAAVIAEMGRMGPTMRVETMDGSLVGFFTEGEARRRWTPKEVTDRLVVIQDALSDEQREGILREQLDRGGLTKRQRNEVRQILGPQSRLIVWEAPRQKGKTNKAPTTPRKTAGTSAGAKVEVVTSKGVTLGSVKKSSITKRQGKWDRDFYGFDGTRVVLSPGVTVPSNRKGGLMNALDKAYSSFKADKYRRQSSGKEVPEGHTAKRRRTASRRRIIERVLDGRSPECWDYVLGLLDPKESKDVPSLVERETEDHPELYEGIESYERVRLAATALANIYDRERSDATEDLLERAHLFEFDDEAWWEARGCHDPLTHLPYPVCLVEDVLIWQRDDEILSRALTESAMEAASRRMLSFVVNRCHAHEASDGVVSYAKTMAPLPGGMVASTISARQTVTWNHRYATHARQGRSPRVHTRRGHWRNQAYGPGMKLHKRIWISDTIVGPSGKAYRVTEPTRVHLVTMS